MKPAVAAGWARDGSQIFQKSLARAISMSVSQILKAKEIICIVPDARKAPAVKLCFEGEVSPMAPASILRRHSAATIYLDSESTSFAQSRYTQCARRSGMIGDRMTFRYHATHTNFRRISVALAGQMESGRPRSIPSLRWWIGGNFVRIDGDHYIDRQTLSILAPYLKQDYHWTNVDYANIAIAFRIAYSVGQTVCGRLMDRVGTRRGLTISVTRWYSIVSLLTSLANGLSSFALFRFLLGAGESANWPGASKGRFRMVPKRERGLAAALVRQRLIRGRCGRAFPDPAGVPFRWGGASPLSFQDARILVADRLAKMYHLPQDHPRISDARAPDDSCRDPGSSSRWKTAAAMARPFEACPQTWGTIISKGLTDPVWFFVTDWFPSTCSQKVFRSRAAWWQCGFHFLPRTWAIFFGGGVSGYLIRRGWPLGAARKALVVFGGFGVLLLIPTVFTVNLYLITLLFGLATFSYAIFSTIAKRAAYRSL